MITLSCEPVIPKYRSTYTIEIISSNWDVKPTEILCMNEEEVESALRYLKNAIGSFTIKLFYYDYHGIKFKADVK
jgi:hypothetical protein